MAIFCQNLHCSNYFDKCYYYSVSRPEKNLIGSNRTDKTRQSIMWYNPSVAPKPHSVTFALDNNTPPELSATFAVKNSSNFMPIFNFSSEPVIIPNRNNPVNDFDLRIKCDRFKCSSDRFSR